MKIGVISDTHGAQLRFTKALQFLHDVDLIMHAGDVLYHGPRNPILNDYNPLSLANQINALEVPIVIARGNCDSDVDQNVINVPIQSPYAYVFANGKRIVMTHGTQFIYCNDPQNVNWEGMLVQIAEEANRLHADIFITGHIHNNILERRGNSILLNPGSPSLPNRADKRSTVAIIDEQSIDIFDLDSSEVLLQLEI